jgi:cytochrome c553
MREMSKEAARRALEAQLGTRAPKAVAALSEQDIQDLADAIQAARQRQAAALAEAGERALSRIPRVLRGPVRKVAGG